MTPRKRGVSFFFFRGRSGRLFLSCRSFAVTWDGSLWRCARRSGSGREVRGRSAPDCSFSLFSRKSLREATPPPPPYVRPSLPLYPPVGSKVRAATVAGTRRLWKKKKKGWHGHRMWRGQREAGIVRGPHVERKKGGREQETKRGQKGKKWNQRTDKPKSTQVDFWHGGGGKKKRRRSIESAPWPRADSSRSVQQRRQAEQKGAPAEKRQGFIPRRCVGITRR